MKYFKILNELENHKGFQYKTGLNIDTVPFNDSSQECTSGGLYYADAENILNFLDYGIFIREVEIPKNAKIVNFKDKSRADRIILKKRRDLRKVKTWGWLIKNGADVAADDNRAIKWASKNGHIDVVKLLIDAGADVAADDNRAIILASKNGHIDVVKLLIDAGADVTADDNRAILASKNGHIDVVKLLIDAGADVTAYDNRAIKWASKNGHIDVVKLLIDAGAKI